MLARSKARSDVSMSAWIVAVRLGSSPNTLISPTIAPESSRLKICSTRPLTFLDTRTAPERTKNISSPGSPSRNSTSPLRSRRSRRRGQRAANCSSSRSRSRSTCRRKAMSSGLATGVVSPLHGPALHHDGLDGPNALCRRRLTLPTHRLEHGVALVGGQRVFGQYRRGVAHELGEEIRVGHDSSDQIAEAQRLHTPPWISGDPGGIRTRGLDLERVASWARLDDGV